MPAPARPSRSRAGAPRQRVAAAGPANEVRIIGGLWKRTKLPVANKPGLRPTPDRVRETLFNWLDHDLSGWRCIDAFAGTGALGFEAASRGAGEVTLVEQDADLVDKLRALKARLQADTVQVQRGNGVTALQRIAPAGMDLVFLDPPFEAALYDKLLPLLASVLTERGRVYLEAPRAWDDGTLAPFGLSVQRYLKAGAVHAHLLRRSDNAPHAELAP